jgi:hypothetical protein
LNEISVSDGLAVLVGQGGNGRSFGFEARSELEQGLGFAPLTSSGSGASGHAGTIATGDALFGARADYTIPLNFLRYGLPALFGRRWLGPESTVFYVNLFLEHQTISGPDVFKGEISETTLNSAGFDAAWSLWTNENESAGLEARYTFSKDLNGAKNTNSFFATSARITF